MLSLFFTSLLGLICFNDLRPRCSDFSRSQLSAERARCRALRPRTSEVRTENRQDVLTLPAVSALKSYHAKGPPLVLVDLSSRDATPFVGVVRQNGRKDSATLPAVSALTSLTGVQRSTLVVFDSSRRFGSSTKGVRDTWKLPPRRPHQGGPRYVGSFHLEDPIKGVRDTSRPFTKRTPRDPPKGGRGRFGVKCPSNRPP